jgi:hypothetical protein
MPGLAGSSIDPKYYLLLASSPIASIFNRQTKEKKPPQYKLELLRVIIVRDAM